ncbi:hypothetical protein LAT59_04670 [Candidatus Gracilibacteria bacterium]|nr:hypothetical protein [Candidatus Gracilibacteria bacterium]
MRYSQKGTILVYTLILVILGVFMALGTLNLAQKLEADYAVRQLDMFFSDTIKSKSNILLKYGKNLNNSGGGFIDNIGCPQNISFSGSTQAASGVETILRFQDDLFFCEGLYDENDFRVYFNPDFTDTQYLEYEGHEIPFNNSLREGTLGDSEETYVDGNNSFPLQPDGIDDNFDSDNYRMSSTGSLLYPDDYRDNDVDHRLMKFGYIPPGSGWYNIFWSNDRMREYIDGNTNNIPPILNLGEVTQGYIYLDINTQFNMRIVRFDRNAYTEFNELRVLESWESVSTSGGSIGYLQSDLSLLETITYGSDGSTIISGDPTGEEFDFDFQNNDYAIFIQNMNLDTTLLYQMKVENVDGTEVYSVPILDDDSAIISILGSHVIFGRNGLPIGEQLEIIQLK